MARSTQIQNSFISGELSPRLYGRNDLKSYYNGCSELTNFIVYPHGGITKRPGFRYMATAGDSANTVRLIRFEFSEDDAYVLEFGEGYVRFFTQGGQVGTTTSGVFTPYEISTTYSGSELMDIKYVQTGDTYYLVHSSHIPAKLYRNVDETWTLEDVGFVNGPFLDKNTEDIWMTPSATTGNITITVTSGTGVFDSEHVGALWKFSNPTERTATISGANQFTDYIVLDVAESFIFSCDSSSWTSTTVTIQKSTDGGTNYYDYFRVAGDSLLEISEQDDDETLYRVGVKTAEFGGANVNVRITKTDDWGYLQITGVTSSTVATGTVVIDLPNTNATRNWSEGCWSEYRGYPSSVTFYEGRLLLAGSTYQPQTIWGSVVDDYENFKAGVADDNSYSYTLTSSSINKILWMLDNRILHAGSLGGEWKFGSASDPTTPTNVDAKMYTSHGSANIQGVGIENAVFFIQKGGKRLRAKSYDYTIDGYRAVDLSMKSDHLFDEVIVDMAFQSLPFNILWFVTQDGNLISLSYSQENEILAYSKHTTDGLFENIAIIPGSSEDELWVVVKRNINGADVRYIEQMQNIDWDPDTDMSSICYLDSAIYYSGEHEAEFDGADHLAGEVVYVSTNGSAYSLPITVSASGTFTLDAAYTDVKVGLDYAAVMRTMELAQPGQAGTSYGKQKKPFKIDVMLRNTMDLSIGKTSANVDDVNFNDEVYNGHKQLEFPAGTDKEMYITLVSNQQLPCTILNLSYVIYSTEA